MKYCILLASLSLLIFSLSGCGGGDGDDTAAADSSTPPVADTTPPANDDGDDVDDVIEPEDEPSPFQMTDINVAKDYDFSTNFQVGTAIDVGSLTDQRAFVGLYEKWSDTENDIVPNPASQLVLQAVDDGLFSQDLTISKGQTQLLMVVLFMDPTIEPIKYIFDLEPEATLTYP